jgi:hypothetical protein
MPRVVPKAKGEKGENLMLVEVTKKVINVNFSYFAGFVMFFIKIFCL